jgi:hypothetical protein
MVRAGQADAVFFDATRKKSPRDESRGLLVSGKPDTNFHCRGG